MVDIKSRRLPASIPSKVRNCAEPPEHLPGLRSRKSRHPTPGNFDYPTPTPTPDRLRPSAVLVS